MERGQHYQETETTIKIKGIDFIFLNDDQYISSYNVTMRLAEYNDTVI